MPASPAVTAALLSWYDRHRRALPWRAVGGAEPDPYAVWLSEVMLQQTTVAAVKGFYARFLALWPDVAALAAAPREAVLKEWAGLGYYARARNLHDCAAAVVERHGGRFPRTETELRALPGIGDYTAAAVAAIAFGEVATVVDGNVERVMTRLHAVETPVPAARPEIRRLTAALVPRARPGDFAQATMDLGATICTPRSPACAICPLTASCAARAAGTQALYPRKLPRKAVPRRFGAMAVVERADGAVLVRTRPSKGLLGGMTEFFGSDWGPAAPAASEMAEASGAALERVGQVEHVFTHFALTLDVYRGRSRSGAAPEGCRWVGPAQLAREPIPNAFAKVWDAAAGGTASAVVPVAADGLGLVGLE
ncbi:A/G-specific adenine glycosylase [Lichenibacterium minor]|uniref:Adenine DNA glycosylase n=1 Tax=Lichenibacterium minor TaxID=2316528 RepID=A0A4Q2U7C4_9HYPH|nr:A/G-specific adenine glycosylase [Lichenibacterium minor]RYC30816.1 A/G-specific adenine glycosylase [Lichenibacterium minor]